MQVIFWPSDLDPEALGIRPGLGLPPNRGNGAGEDEAKKVASIFFIFGPRIEETGPGGSNKILEFPQQVENKPQEKSKS